MTDLLSRMRLSPADARVEFIGASDELAGIGKGGRVILCGQLTFASLSNSHPGREYIRQYGRTSVRRGLLPGLGQKAPELSVWADRAAATAATAAHARVGFAVDHYMNWGLSRAGGNVLIGGYPDKTATSIQVLAFNNRSLKQIFEKNLPAYDHPRFPSELSYLLDEVRGNFPGYRLHWAAPLEPLPDDYLQTDIINIGMDPFRRILYRPVVVSEGEAPFLQRFGPSAGLFAVVFLVSAGLLWKPWHDYRVAWRQYQFETDPGMSGGRPRNFPAMLYRQASNKLEVLQMQKDFLNTRPPQMDMAVRLRQAVDQVALLPRVTIKQFWIGTPGGAVPGVSPEAADVTAAGALPAISFIIAVPTNPKLSALDQANALLKDLSTRLGMTLHLDPRGMQELRGPNGVIGQRIFMVED